jgi:alkanesulfonate monooxygenase SsuD/methylene tetrahydromethanopterin reductase-like flavin-dependent oxidoreductase (luciferase family)
LDRRFARFEEGLEVIDRLLRSDTAVDFAGAYYHLREAILLPRPARPGGPPILIGGNGPRRTLPLVVRYAAEWNGVYASPATYADLNRQLDELLTAAGREPASVRRSLMAGCFFGRNAAELERRAAAHGTTVDKLRASGKIAVGDGAEMREQLAAWAEAGVQRIMLQWLDLDDLTGLEALAAAVL